MFIVSGSSTVFRSWTAGISTGTGRVQTVKDVADFSSGAIDNQEEHSIYSVEKGFDVNDTVSLFLSCHRVSFQVIATKKKRNSPSTKMIKKSNASFRAARNMLKQMKE